LYDTFHKAWAAHVLEIEDRAAARDGIEQRHPFYDRRLIEYAFALPEEQRFRSKQTKFILRQAMTDLIPASLIKRENKANFTNIAAGQLTDLGGERLFDSMVIASLGWVNAEKLREFCRTDIRGGNIWTLWKAYGLELWANEVLGKSRAPSPTADAL
jgi:asparagine synthase (glutamine-hydrolysing)